ncbi:MAG: 2-C-methyl-D-erythritol 2,4-cyclodiphosphate synthase [Deltaproteobacteria bacterium]|nr:2-C-methyl-D-erythritol 2,4-cyclodiphosphate synthase [Deltaproteobacteria bacterium]
MRVGLGYDVHRLVEGRKLILGGVEIPHKMGLLGHSDADVLIHAVMDGLLGAAGLGDIGVLFPDSDPAFKGISSLKLLEEVHRRILRLGYRIGNIDAVILAEEPKMRPHIPEMIKAVSHCLGIKPDQVGIKATTTEGLGFVGRQEGIAAKAAVIIIKAK